MASSNQDAKYHVNGLAAPPPPPPQARQTTRAHQSTNSSQFYPRTIGQTTSKITNNHNHSRHQLHQQQQPANYFQQNYQHQTTGTNYVGEGVQVMLRESQRMREQTFNNNNNNQMTTTPANSSPRHNVNNYNNHHDDDDDDEQTNSGQHYADQLRRSQHHTRLAQQAAPVTLQTMRSTTSGSPASQLVRECEQVKTSTSTSTSTRSQQHVNFGQKSGQKSSQVEVNGGGGESSRKKKYLTAKYGAQQMSLIKKRLKIEMWLHERLQELIKLSKAIDANELDEIDIDLDELLDLEDDATRTHSLRKTLAPLVDLPRDSIEQFISDVLEQSKLL